MADYINAMERYKTASSVAIPPLPEIGLRAADCMAVTVLYKIAPLHIIQLGTGAADCTIAKVLSEITLSGQTVSISYL